ncbi:MAG: hypothetical protein ACYC2U_01680 [Candidatus Amoebophilus sp.]
MNYRKTKTIQKATLAKRGISGALLLFLLLAAQCTSNEHAGISGGQNHNLPIDPKDKENSKARNKFLSESLGYSLNHGQAGLEHKIILDAQANVGKDGEVLTRKDSYNQKDTAFLPSKKDGIRYFAQIARKSVVGDKEKLNAANKRRAKSGALEIEEGIHGEMKEVFDKFLGTKNAKTAKHPRFYVVAHYMGLSDKMRAAVLTGPNKDNNPELIKQLRKYLEEFVDQVKRVRPDGEGVEIIIPVKGSELEYQTPSKGSFVTKIKQMTGAERRKHYTLDKDLSKELDDVIKKVEDGINVLDKELK